MLISSIRKLGKHGNMYLSETMLSAEGTMGKFFILQTGTFLNAARN